jgi:hypothetical protein
LHYGQSDYRLARHDFQRALDTDERALGKNHLLICARLDDLGRCLKALGEVDASAACYDRGAQILRANRPASAADAEEAVSQSA